MKTKRTFRLWDKREKRYVTGWHDLQSNYHLGISNDRNDETIINICFWKERDEYLEFQEVEDK